MLHVLLKPKINTSFLMLELDRGAFLTDQKVSSFRHDATLVLLRLGLGGPRWTYK